MRREWIPAASYEKLVCRCCGDDEKIGWWSGQLSLGSADNDPRRAICKDCFGELAYGTVNWKRIMSGRRHNGH